MAHILHADKGQLIESGLASLSEKLLGLADAFSGGLRIMYILTLGEAVILFPLLLSAVAWGTSGSSSAWYVGVGS